MLNKKLIKGSRIKEYIFIALMLFIPIAHFIIFWLYINLNSILLAFQYNVGDKITWGFKYFEVFYKDVTSANSEILGAIFNTFKYFSANIFITLPLSLLLCYFLYKKIKGYKFFRFVFYLPSIISATVMVVLFKYIIGVNGPIGVITAALGKDFIPFLSDSSYATKTILFYVVSFGLGGNMILLSGAMSNIDESIIEAGKIDGVNMTREIFQIVIPLIWPTLSTMIILAFVGMFGASGPILLFTNGAYNTYTISFWIYQRVQIGAYNYPAAIGLIFTLIGTPIALTMRHILNKSVQGAED